MELRKYWTQQILDCQKFLIQNSYLKFYKKKKRNQNLKRKIKDKKLSKRKKNYNKKRMKKWMRH
jgi:hypothetical protein